MKKKPTLKRFKDKGEMEEFLDTQDLSEEFEKHGVVKKPQLKKINLDLPLEVIQQIDHIAAKIGVSRQPLLKIWINERLKVEGMK